MGNDGSKRQKEQGFIDNTINTDIFDPSWIEAFGKSFTFVWCDASIGTSTNSDDDRNTIMQLAKILNKKRQIIHTFNTIDECYQFISEADNVCLIVSGSMGQELVPMVHNLEQIHSIYIFCHDKEKHSLWALHYAKVLGVFTAIDYICDSLESIVITRSSMDYDKLEIDVIINDDKTSIVDSKLFSLTYSKLCKIILCHNDPTDHSLQEMINYCKSEYKTEYQQELINDFEKNCSQHNPIWWYTKNYFFQGILNRALRTHDLYALCSMRYFIRIVHKQLTELNQVQKSQTTTTTTTSGSLDLFIGQFLSLDEFNAIKRNIDGFVSINQFVVANSELGIAVTYIKQQKFVEKNPNMIRVVFQIHIDPQQQSIATYANIGAVSPFIHAQDYLIAFYSVYRIAKVEKLIVESDAWLIHLHLIDTNETQYNNAIQGIRNIQMESFDLTDVLYTVMSRLYTFKSVNKAFKQALPDDRERLRTLISRYNLAIIYDALNQFEKSLKEYEIVREIARKFIPNCCHKDDICLVPLYSNMAFVFGQLNKFSHAINHAFRALQIIMSYPDGYSFKKEFQSSSYLTLASIHDQEYRQDEAKKFYEEALRIRQEYLPSNHSDVDNIRRHLALLTENQISSTTF